MKKIAVIGAYKKNYLEFLESVYYHSKDKFVFVNNLDKVNGREFSSYILMFDVEQLPNESKIIEEVIKRIKLK